MIKILVASFLGLVLLGAGCAGGAAPEVVDDGTPQKSTAFIYQFGIVVDSLDDAVNDTDIDNIDPYRGYASFARQGLPGIVQIAKADELPEIAAEIQRINDELKVILDQASTLQELKDGVNPLVVQLRALQD